MRIVVAECSAIYSGRGDTSLARGRRAIIIKDDGSVSIHNEVGNKPLNYMKCAEFSQMTNDRGESVWVFDARKESLAITMHDLLSDYSTTLITDDPGLVRDGTELDLQAWVARNPEVIGEGYKTVQREYPTGNGPVDILVLDENDVPVAVEIKRVAMLTAVDQVRRYADALRGIDGPVVHESGIVIDFSDVRGIVVAADIRPKTQALADKRGIKTVTVPPDWQQMR